MNKKTLRNKKRKHPGQITHLPGIIGEFTLAASPTLATAFIDRYRPELLSLRERVAAHVKEELAAILTYQRQTTARNQSKLFKFVAKFNSLFGERQPKPELKHTVKNAYAFADEIIEDIGTSELACRNGCNWCCTFKVAVSIPEAFYIAGCMNDSLSPDAFAEMKEKISQTTGQVAGMSDKDRKVSRIFCPLLVDGSCSVYHARPLTCRGYNSSNESVCKRNYLSRYDANVPHKIRLKEKVYTVFYGIIDGTKASGLQSNSVELVAVLNFIFQNPDVEARWLQGEEVFPPEVIMFESYNPSAPQ